MKHRYALLPLLLLVALLVAVPALARTVPQAERLLGTPLKLAQPNQVTGDCVMGVAGDAAWAVDYLAPPEDAYYTLLDPSTCGCTGTTGVMLAWAHMVLYFPTAACSFPVTVSVVAADLTDPACPVPLPEQVICPPLSYTPAPTSTGLWDFCMPLYAGCCVTTKVFLKVQFDGTGDCSAMPKLVTTDACEPCVSWNGYPPTHMDELCGLGFPGNLKMYVGGICCDVVPTLGGTWGRLKTLYR